MPNDFQFWLFQDGDDGPVWRGSFDDIDHAKRKGQKLADEERQQFFVYSFWYFSEIVRMFPSRSEPQGQPG